MLVMCPRAASPWIQLATAPDAKRIEATHWSMRGWPGWVMAPPAAHSSSGSLRAIQRMTSVVWQPWL